MRFVQKQLIGEMKKNKVFLSLMLVLSAFTSYMYFFVHFSIDGNMAWLERLPVQDAEQLLFQNGLVSNTLLVRYIFMAFTALTGFVFGMFYYRFFRSAEKQLGCLKTLGFQDRDFMRVFLTVSGGIALLGAAAALPAGYFTSDVLLAANRQSYLVTGVVKGIRPASLVIGCFVPGAVFCLITFWMYRRIRRKEIGELLTGVSPATDCSISFRLADKVSGWFPEKNRLSIRLALRNPVAILLIVSSVTVVSTMFILAYSLNVSSKRVYETQVLGHYYLYERDYGEPQRAEHEPQGDTDSAVYNQSIQNERIQTGSVKDGSIQNGSMTNKSIQNESPQTVADFYLTAEGTLDYNGTCMEGTLAGGNGAKEIFELLDRRGNPVAFPEYGELVISTRLEELYGIKSGDTVMVKAGGREHPMKVSGVAYNAKQGWIYVSKEELCEMLSLPENSHTVIFCREDIFTGGTVITDAQKKEALERGMVSNRVSAVINQVIGCVIGCILLFLALLLNFQSCTGDMLILRLMGYQKREINSLLVDIYKPLLFAAYVLTLPAAVLITKNILRTLSIQIGDYMMFETNLFVVAGVLVLLYLIYFAVQSFFLIGISKIFRNEMTAEEL